MSATPELAKLFGTLHGGQMSHYLHVSAACAFVCLCTLILTKMGISTTEQTYDHLTTLADEVALIWPAPWGLGKALFLASRYLAWPEFILVIYIDVFNLPDSVCYGGFFYLTLSIVAGIVITQTVLILRTWAIWGGRRIIVQGLGLLLLAITSVNAWILTQYLQNTRVLQIPGMVGCVIVSSSKTIVVTWITISCFEFVIVSMTVIKAIEHFRFGSSTLLVSLYRDGFMYYIFLSTVSLANLIVVVSASAEYIALLGVLQRAFHSIIACRIILNLRALRATPQSTVSGTETVSGWFGAKAPRGGSLSLSGGL